MEARASPREASFHVRVLGTRMVAWSFHALKAWRPLCEAAEGPRREAVAESSRFRKAGECFPVREEVELSVEARREGE